MSKIVTVNLPDIGEGVVEGEVIEWLKNPGDLLQQDEPVVIVMTDKATVELPAPHPGVLAKRYFEAGGIAIRDKPLYDIEVADTVSGTKESSSALSKAPIVEEVIPPAKVSQERSVVSRAEGVHAKAMPHARQLAYELNLDINKVSGTGPEGVVTADDIAHYLMDKKSTIPPLTDVLRLPGDQEKPILGIRNLMAKRMVESKNVIPHFSYFEQLDATRLVQLRSSFKEEADKQNISVTYMPFIIRALSLSLQKFSMVNASVDVAKNVVVLHQKHNVGIAMTTKLGLIVPVLKDVQEMSLNGIILAYEELKQRALAGKLQPVDMKDATISISNFGVLGGGGMWATPIINFPEAAILGLSKIQKFPVVRNGEVVVRDMLNLSWSFDHRIIDGDMAATFSHHFSTLLQNPAPLL